MKKSTAFIYNAALIILIMCPVILFLLFGKYIHSENNENRALKEMPAFSVFDISSYPSEFEAFFEDNLPFKNSLVLVNSYINYKVFKTSNSPNVIVGRDGWLFYKGAQNFGENPVADYQGSNLYTDAELEIIAENMQAAKEALESRGIKFALLLIPNKERVYDKYMPASYGEVAQNNRMEQVADYLIRNTDIRVVNITEELKEYAESPGNGRIYYKYDTHWNHTGAYIAAQIMGRELGFELPDISSLTENLVDAPSMDLAVQLSMQSVLNEGKIAVYEGFTDRNIKSTTNEAVTEFNFRDISADAGGEKLLILGDSFSGTLGRYMSAGYEETYAIFNNNYTAKILDEYKPDVVVFETVERFIDKMLSFDINKSDL